MYLHVHTYSTRGRVQADTHSYTRTSRIHTCIHTYIHTYMHTYIHTLRIHIHIHTVTNAVKHTCMHPYLHAGMHTRTQIRIIPTLCTATTGGTYATSIQSKHNTCLAYNANVAYNATQASHVLQTVHTF